MPRIVDHQQRRDAVARVALSLIVEHGLDALTVRKVARAAGFSTAIVSHYFADKRQMLLYVYRFAVLRAAGQIRDALDAHGHDVVACLEALLPLTPQSREYWAIWLALWDWSTSDPELSAEQNLQVRNARQMVASVVEGAVAEGRLPAGTDSAVLARRLVTMTNGLAVQILFDPADWSREQIRDAIRYEIGLRP